MLKQIEMILVEITVIIVIKKNKWDRTFPQDYVSVRERVVNLFKTTNYTDYILLYIL